MTECVCCPAPRAQINFVHDNMDFHNSLINASHTVEYLIFSAQPMQLPLSEKDLQMHNFLSEMESKAYKVSHTNSLGNSQTGSACPAHITQHPLPSVAIPIAQSSRRPCPSTPLLQSQACTSPTTRTAHSSTSCR